eukprot:14510331-Alexandrium_andersonii.AAC.1
MSASLVGSEMCIRDSVARTRLRERHRLGSRLRLVEPLVQAWRDGREAVSYTHLTLPTICSV